jgi:hypothetical protein
MATCEGCCQLTGSMLNLAAEAADRARIGPTRRDTDGGDFLSQVFILMTGQPAGQLDRHKYNFDQYCRRKRIQKHIKS